MNTFGKRLFLGLMAPKEAQLAIDNYRQSWRWPVGARLVPLSKLHLTLHFLGEVDHERQVALQAALAEIRCEPSQVKLVKPEIWVPGIAVSHAAVSYGLAALHELLAGILRALDLPVDSRPWQPHVTLARHAGGAVAPVLPAAVGWAVDRFSLVWSHAGDYEVLQTW